MSPTQATRLILLGTKGGPRVTAGRANPANVVMVAGEPYVVDCGYGVTRQLIAAGIEPARVRKIFITHHHSDHILELGPLIYNIWAGRAARAGGRVGPAAAAADHRGLPAVDALRHRHPHRR